MLFSVFSFALMQVCVKYLHHIPAPELVLFRSLITLVLSYAIINRKGLSPFGNNKKFLILRGLFGTVALTLYFFTLQRMPIATAATLQYLSPIFTAVFAIWLLKEKLRPVQWLFFAMAFGGVWIIKGAEGVPLLWVLAGITSAIFAGLAYNCIRILRHTDAPVVIVFYFPLVALPAMLVLSYFDWVWPQGIDWILILAMGVFTQFGQIYMTKSLHAEKANTVATLKYTGIFYALGFDFFLFGISYGWMTYVGMLLVMTGVLLNVLRKD
ncbi:MAG: DMT family transporter [Flavobacteriales bacterium]|nr:DMT family transporter [Flavobacteriales bacterium]